MTTIGLELLPPFLAVTELGSFSAAAARLGVEKSSVSRAVARLEHAVGERLFVRTTRRVALTNAGQAMRDRLREPYDNLDAAMTAHLLGARSPRGKVVLTAPPDFGLTVLSEALVRFGRRFPHVEVDVRLSNQYVDLVSNKVDFALRMALRSLKDSSLKARKLADCAVGIFASRSYVEARGVPQTPDEARLHPCVVLRGVRELRMHGPDGAIDLPLQGRLTCDDMSFVHHAVLHGAGLGMLPHFLADADVREGRLVQLFSRWTMQAATLWFLTPAKQKPTRATEALRETISELMAARPASFRVR
jgi:DNA-binding transcriptional LysR family regulator